MLLLDDLQTAFTRSMLEGTTPNELLAWVHEDGIPAAKRLRIYRNTMLAALAGALRLTFPTVNLLVGEACFDQAATAFARQSPPTAPQLDLYGEGFAAFLQTHAPVAGLAYLPDVARVDWLMDHAGDGSAAVETTISLGGVTINLAASLRLLAVQWPVLEIREAVLGDDEASLGRIALEPGPRRLVIWQDDEAAALQELDAGPWTFLCLLLNQEPVEEALAAAQAADPKADLIAVITRQILQAPFARVIQFSGVQA